MGGSEAVLEVAFVESKIQRHLADSLLQSLFPDCQETPRRRENTFEDKLTPWNLVLSPPRGLISEDQESPR